MEYFPYLQKDIEETMSYILPGIIMGIVVAAMVLIGIRIFNHEWKWNKFFVWLLFVSYVAIVIQIAYLSRQPGSRTDVAFGLGDTWGTTIQAHAYVIENVMMFIPFGILFPMLGKCCRRLCIPVMICASIALESVQYLTGRGYCQLDDVVTNVIGGCIGYIAFLFIYRIAVIIRKIKQ